MIYQNYVRGFSMKICSRCKIGKLKYNFSKNKKNKDGLNYWCKECDCEYQKERRKGPKYKENINEYMGEYRKNPRVKSYYRNYNLNLKIQALVHYSVMKGVPVCSHPDCLIMNLDMLSIDHINNDGAEHRKLIKRKNIYKWLVDHNFPEGFQVYCMNHNFKKQIEKFRGV